MCSEFKASLSEILSRKTTGQRKRPRRGWRVGEMTGKVLARNSEHQPSTHERILGKKIKILGVLVHTCNPSPGETE